MQTKAFLTALFFLLALTMPARSLAAEAPVSFLETSKCSKFLTFTMDAAKSAGAGIKLYWSDVYKTRGRRLILNESRASTDSSRGYGILSPRRPIESWLGKLRYTFRSLPLEMLGVDKTQQYELTPLHALYDWTVNRPIGWATEKSFGRRFEPSGLIKFALVTAFSFFVYTEASGVYDSSLSHKIDADILVHTPEYTDEIKYDFRFHSVHERLAKGEINSAQAIREAYRVNLAYNQYYRYRDSVGEFRDLPSNMKLINHMLFSPLNDVFKHGLHAKNGFIVPPQREGPISDTQKLELFSVYHLLYLKYQLILEMVQDTPLFHSIISSGSDSPILQGILNDPFTQAMLNLRDSGSLNAKEVQSLLQEDAYWQSQFDVFKILGIEQQKIENGQLTDKPLTLIDIRQEMLSSIP